MKFLVHKNDFNIDYLNADINPHKIDSSTSVNHLKIHFYTLLSEIGELIQLSEKDSKKEWQDLCQKDDTVFASFHEEPLYGIGCRFLKHSLGSLMLVGGYLGGWEFRDSSCNLVTSQKQAEQLKTGLGDACPNLDVLVPALKTNIFRLPSLSERKLSRENLKIHDDTFHILYTGRIIANKGLAQLVRALNLWPVKNARFSIVGSYEPDFLIYHSNAYHTTFPEFFKREVVYRSPLMDINLHSAKPHFELRDIFWSSDCFVYPSFHEDENFGMAPREAMLSGVPAVVSDFCGLGQLAQSKSKIVKTYPTLGGVRYSLFELRQKISEIKGWSEDDKKTKQDLNYRFVLQESDSTNALTSLRNATKRLLEKQPGASPKGGWRSKNRVDRWAAVGPDSFKNAVNLKKTQPPAGLFVDGTGFPDNTNWFSDIHFQKAIQAFYTTLPKAPEAKSGKCYRGFWRVTLWPEEKAVAEFGYPGPRIKRLNKSQWNLLIKSSKVGELGEVIFIPDNNAIGLIQELLELGYLVPDSL